MGRQALIWTVLELERGKKVTTRQLADQYGLSQRTAQRMMLELEEWFVLAREHCAYRAISRRV